MSVSAILDEAQKLGDEEKSDLVVELVARMSVLNACKLVKKIETTFDVKATGGGGQIVPNLQQEKAPPPVEEKTAFTVMLKGVTDVTKKIGLIKEVRGITGLGLKEAKDLVDAAPRIVRADIPKADAEAAKKRLEDAGGVVELT